MALSIISLIFSFLALIMAGVAILKIYKLYLLFKKEDITTEKGDSIFINNNKF